MMAHSSTESGWPTVLWSGLLALVFAWAFDDGGRAFAGVLTGAGLGYLLIQLGRMRRHADALQRRLMQLELQVTAATIKSAKPAPETQAAAAAEPAALPRATPLSPAPASRATAPPASTPHRADVAVSAPKPAARPAPEPAEPSFAEIGIAKGIAWLRAGNPLARAGIVVLFFGAAFLAKYAAEHSMLPLELRLAALGAGALGLLITGWRLRDRGDGRNAYAQILQGGGIAGLYLTIFASARLYHLMPNSLALGLLVVIAVASALLAVAQNALPLAVIGFAGGFLAPVMLSTGEGNHITLFTYYAVLNLGVFAVAWFRAWRVLNLIGFVFTFSITGAWRAMSYQPEQVSSAVFFLLLFFVMYVAVSILFALRQKPARDTVPRSVGAGAGGQAPIPPSHAGVRSPPAPASLRSDTVSEPDLRGYVSATLVFGLPVVVFSLQASLLKPIEYGLAWSALGFGLFYLALAWALFINRRDSLRLLAEAFAALGVIFSSLAIPLAFDQQTTAAMWAVEGAGLLWLGVRQERKLARAFGALLQALAGLRYLASLPVLHTEPVLLNSATVGALLLALTGLLSARWLHAHREKLASYEMGAPLAAILWSLAWWLYGGLAEVERSMPAQGFGVSLSFAALTALALDRLGQGWNWPLQGPLALMLTVAAGLTALLTGLSGSHPFAEAGWAGWLIWFAVLYRLLWRQEQQAGAEIREWLPRLHAAAFWLLAYLIARESAWQIAQSISGIWGWLPWGIVPALFLIAVNRAAPQPSWPLRAQADAYRVRGSAPLAAFAVLWIVLVNFSGNGDPAEIPYLPLLNPLDLSVAFVLTSLGYYALALSPEERSRVWRLQEPLTRAHFAAAAAGLIFLWLNSALVRALHHSLGTPYSLHEVVHSVTVLASLSIFWSLLGLATLSLAARRGWRSVWIAGAALLAVVVLKLFVLDLDGRGTLARIVSFMSVGGVLLLAGYLSPLPPARPAEKEAT